MTAPASLGRRGFLFMRSLVLLSLLSWLPHSEAADALRQELTRGVTFLEQRIAADPDDFNAANQLADRLLRRAAWTGALDDLRRADAAVSQSLKAIPAEQNAVALALAARVSIGMHRFADARGFAEKLISLQPAKPQSHIILGDA